VDDSYTEEVGVHVKVGIFNCWTGIWNEMVEWTMDWTVGYLHTADSTIFWLL